MPLDPSNLLIIQVTEPNIAHATPAILKLADSADEALTRYKAIIATYLTQLVGLNDCLVRFFVQSAESENDEGAIEAVRIWILSQLTELGSLSPQGRYVKFSPTKNAANLLLEFTASQQPHDYLKTATASPCCLESGARWINMAFLQCSPAQSVTSNYHLEVTHRDATELTPSTIMPDLEVGHIHDECAWNAALLSPIGAKLKKFYESMI